jgi:hypothetical protein
MFKKIVNHTVEGRSFQNKDYDKISLPLKENVWTNWPNIIKDEKITFYPEKLK